MIIPTTNSAQSQRYQPTTDLLLNAGDWVEVRSKSEVLQTLDKDGCLEELPFMPEMFQYCGKRFRVYKRAHKTCDTVNNYRGRTMSNAVHLEALRCDGAAHGGCEAGCLIFFKTAWLKKVDGPQSPSNARGSEKAATASGCTEADVLAAIQVPGQDNGDGPAYRCQATQIPAATQPLSPWQFAQYVEDYKSGNVTLGRIAAGFFYVAYRNYVVNLGIGLGPIARWLWDTVQRIRGGIPFPGREGTIPAGQKTPTGSLNLQPGELVRVKSYRDIVATLDESNRNRGMTFDREMVPYCGGSYRVLKSVKQIVNEKTGKMQFMKTPCIILDAVVCEARFSDCRMFCPRSIYPYWREIWLERVDAKKPGSERTQLATASVKSQV